MSDREIFEFEYNGEIKRVDPVLTHFALLDDEELNLEVDSLTINEMVAQGDNFTPDKDGRESIARIARAVHRAFGVQAFDGENGLTIKESLLVLFRFTSYTASVKKNTDPSLTQPVSTDVTSHSSSDTITSDTSA